MTLRPSLLRSLRPLLGMPAVRFRLECCPPIQVLAEIIVTEGCWGIADREMACRGCGAGIGVDDGLYVMPTGAVYCDRACPALLPAATWPE